MRIEAARTAFLSIDVQEGIDADYHAAEGGRNNPGAEQVIARLLDHWRSRQGPIVHVRHDSTVPQSAYRPGQPGNNFKPEVAPLPGELVVGKRTNSAFIGTALEDWLRRCAIRTVAVAGVATNNSVEASVRMAGNLGFDVFLIDDACFCFGKRDWNGTLRSASEVHAMSLANLHGEYCRVVKSVELLGNRSA